jgi:hypothetical protein
MKKIVSIVVVVGLLIGLTTFNACKTTPKAADTVAAVDTTLNYLTAQEKAEGWILMFDGKTTTGWRGYNKTTFPDSGWVVEDGTLRCIGSGQGEAGGKGGDIIFDQKFTNFLLSLEWKISPGGNSGIFYLGEEIPGEPIWKSAPEMQILDDARHMDANMGKDGNRKAGALYDLIPSKVAEDTAGTWNKAEVMVYQGTVVHKLNGETALEYHLGTPDWDKMIKASKFSTFPEFGKIRAGVICLQDHGNDVWFRNIKIKPLQ